MQRTVELKVYRRLDNRFEGLPDDSPRALELHNRRRHALEALDQSTGVEVIDWGGTKDEESHELVELVVAATGAVLQYALVPGLKWLGATLVEKGVDTALSELTKAVVSRLRPKQEAKEVLDFTIALPDGTAIKVDPPNRAASITIYFNGGAVESLEYASAGDK